MRNLVGVLAATLAILIALPSPSTCEEINKKFGVELQLGGGYSILGDVNNYTPSQLSTYNPDKEINVGAQYGLGIMYRPIENFGWQFGYNRFADPVLAYGFDVASGPETWQDYIVSATQVPPVTLPNPDTYWYWEKLPTTSLAMIDFDP